MPSNKTAGTPHPLAPSRERKRCLKKVAMAIDGLCQEPPQPTAFQRKRAERKAAQPPQLTE